MMANGVGIGDIGDVITAISDMSIEDLEEWVKDIEVDITTKNGEIQEREHRITEMEMEINRLQSLKLQVETAKKGNEKARDERDILMSRKEILDQIISYKYELEEAGRLADIINE